MRQEEILTLKRQGGVPPHNLHAHIPNPNERSRQQSEHAMVTSESTGNSPLSLWPKCSGGPANAVKTEVSNLFVINLLGPNGIVTTLLALGWWGGRK